ncbi:MAG: MFS transporter [Parvularculaceae bacterium]|nr:MFS transporter [Parvularculaceae bacterium]
MKRTPRAIVLAYSIGSIGTGIYLTAPSVLLLYYLTQVLGVSPALAGLAVFIPRLWDLATDPYMGAVSDRTRSRFGRRRPYLLAGAVLTALSFGFLFSAPQLEGELANFVYVLIIYILSATAYTIFAVPYLSMPAEMSEDADERASIMAYRMSFAMTGVLAGAALAPALVAYFGGGRAGFSAMSWVLAAVCAVTMLAAFSGTARAPDITSGKRTNGERRLLAPFRHPGFSLLAAAYFLQLAGLGAFTGAVPYMVTQVMARGESDISTVFLALLGGTLVSLFLWERLARRFGKMRAYFAAAFVTLVGAVAILPVVGPQSWRALIVCTSAVGFGFGGLQLLPFAMLTDLIQEARRKGDDAAGAFTGVWTAMEKGGLAVGPLAVGLILSIGGFAAGAAEQTTGAVRAVRLALAFAPSLFIALSLPAILKFNRI